jgi:LysR family positive regulator for ilvC
VETEALRVFLSMANTLHFGRSSQECNLSPSAVSRTIGRIEEETGRRLFSRDNRSVELTPEGVEFRRYALEALEAWERVKASLTQGQESLAGEISLYSSVAASYTVLAGLFLGFRQRHPGVHVRLQTGDAAKAIERLQAGQADISVAARPGYLPRNLVFKTVAITPLVFIAPTAECESAALTQRSPVPWGQVPMVFTETGLSRKRADAWFRGQGLRPSVYAEVSGHEAVISMVRLGCGVGIVPRIVLDRFAQEGEIRIVPVRSPLDPYEVGLCAQKRRLDSPVVRAFWEMSEAGSMAGADQSQRFATKNRRNG